jgi:hypothetical protein
MRRSEIAKRLQELQELEDEVSGKTAGEGAPARPASAPGVPGPSASLESAVPLRPDTSAPSSSKGSVRRSLSARPKEVSIESISKERSDLQRELSEIDQREQFIRVYVYIYIFITELKCTQPFPFPLIRNVDN